MTIATFIVSSKSFHSKESKLTTRLEHRQKYGIAHNTQQQHQDEIAAPN